MRQIYVSRFLSILLGCIISGYGLLADDRAITAFTQVLQQLVGDQRPDGPLGGERAKRPGRGSAGKHKPIKYVPPADDSDLGDFDIPSEPAKKEPVKSEPTPIKPEKPIVIEPEISSVCAAVQTVSYIKDLTIKIREGDGGAQTIPLAIDKIPLTLDPICSQKGVQTEKKYTVTFNGDFLAEITCIVGPTSDPYMQVVITKEELSSSKILPITSMRFKTPDATSNVLAEIKLPGIKKPTQDTISRVRLMVDMVREKAKNTFKISIDAVPACTSKALIEGINKRADLKKVEIKLDQEAQLVEVPAGKPYVSLGYICQDEGVVTRTCAVLVNGRAIAAIDLHLGPRSSETREATIHVIGPKGEVGPTVSGASDEQISAVAVLDGGGRVRVTVQPIKEGFIKLDNKFKIYIENIAACSTPRARVEVINQRPDLKNVAVIDAYGKKSDIVDVTRQPWILVDEICSNKSAEVRETYRLMLGNKEAAQITCVVGQASENSMQTIVTKGADARDAVEPVTSEKFIAGQAKSSTSMDLFVPGAGRVKVKVELITELSEGSIIINKFKIYLQEIRACESQALVEIINQRKDLKVGIKDNYDLALDVPDTSQRAYVPVGIVCQLPAKNAQETYTLSIASKPVAKITCILGPSSGEFLRATITRLSGATGKQEEITSSDYKGFGKEQVTLPLVVPGLGWLLVKVELIKELGEASIIFNKFKIYVQTIGDCGAQAWVEVQNQVVGLPVVVEDEFGVTTPVHDISGRNYVSLAPVCQLKENIITQRYMLVIANQKVAEVSCNLGPASNETVQATIRVLDAAGKQIAERVGANYETITAIVGPVNGERYLLKVVTEKIAGQTKFKWYLQPLAVCSLSIPVEAQNQTGLSIKVRTQYGKELDVPSVNKVSYVTIDHLCQNQSESVEGLYTIIVNNKPVADVRCVYGAVSKDSHQALIYAYPYVPGSSAPMAESSTWGFCASFPAAALKLKIEPIWESRYKFKFYFQPLGPGC